jgi:hypothetical protein
MSYEQPVEMCYVCGRHNESHVQKNKHTKRKGNNKSKIIRVIMFCRSKDDTRGPNKEYPYPLSDELILRIVKSDELFSSTLPNVKIKVYNVGTKGDHRTDENVTSLFNKADFIIIEGGPFGGEKSRPRIINHLVKYIKPKSTTDEPNTVIYQWPKFQSFSLIKDMEEWSKFNIIQTEKVFNALMFSMPSKSIKCSFFRYVLN